MRYVDIIIHVHNIIRVDNETCSTHVQSHSHGIAIYTCGFQASNDDTKSRYGTPSGFG